MRKYGVLIVGAGWVSSAHIRAFEMDDRAQVVAIMSRTAASAENKRKECLYPEEVTIYTDYDQALQDPKVDVVVICTPNHLHCEQAIKAARAGKHLLIEKPAALTLEDARKMTQVIEENKVISLVGYVLHYNSLFITAKNLQREFLGDIRYAETDYFHRVQDEPCYEWNRTRAIGGSSLLAGGCHAVDAMRWFMQDEVVEVCAYSESIREDFEFPGTTIVLLKFKNGAIAKVGSSYDFISPYVFNVKLCGTKGTLWNDRLWSPSKISGQLDYVTLPVTLPNSSEVTHHPFPQEASHPLDCIDQNIETTCSMTDALKTQEVIAAADLSAETGMPVKLPLDS